MPITLKPVASVALLVSVSPWAIATSSVHACEIHPFIGVTTSPGAGAYMPPLPVTAGSTFSLDVPAYSSVPNAPATIYLDFDGDITPVWGDYQPGTTPAYSIDSDTSTFSPQELANIEQIWSRVSEKFSPFNVNVTTVDPGNRDDLRTLHIVIGGDGRNGAPNYWAGAPAGGIAHNGAFFNNFPNTAFVFPGRLNNGDPRYVADASAHESGHGFGLFHQALYDANGALINEYNPGDAMRAPIMGRSYESARSQWWNGPSLTAGLIQDDLSKIAAPINAFGFRADDHANTAAGATTLIPNGNQVQARGIIEFVFPPFPILTDADYFAFDTLAGDVSFVLDVAPFGAMLDASLLLYDVQGQLLASSITPSLGESLVTTVTAGSYFVAVTSAGNYGDVGQYWLSGTVVAIPEPAAALMGAGVVVLGLCARQRRGLRRATPSTAA